MTTNTTRLIRLERARPAAILPTGGAVHEDAEHVAAVLAALEESGAIRYPIDLPEDQRAADVINQLEALRRWPQVLT